MSDKVWSICSKGCDKYQNNGTPAFTCCIRQICKISGLVSFNVQHQNGLKLTYLNAAAEKMNFYLPCLCDRTASLPRATAWLLGHAITRIWTLNWLKTSSEGGWGWVNPTPSNNKSVSFWWNDLPDPAENTGATTCTDRGAEDDHLSVVMWILTSLNRSQKRSCYSAARKENIYWCKTGIL